MIPKEKALQIYNKMDEFTNGYVGSTMLFYTEFDDAKKNRTKKAAIVVVEEIVKAIDFDWMEVQNLESEHRFWKAVEKEIESL